MQLVTAIIKQQSLDSVKEALQRLGIQGMTVSDVKGFGRQGGHTETYRGTDYTVDFVPKVRVEVLTDSSGVDDVIKAICASAKSGQIGDGKIWVTDVNHVMRIRTGEEGVDAI